MKELLPPSSASHAPIAHEQNRHHEVRALFDRYVMPTYGRFDLVLARGQGSRLWDVNGKEFLDLGGGIAVCSLGHAHPEITETLIAQSRAMLHVSNLYYHEPQGRLAEKIVSHLAPGRVFFSNSGGEANEGLFKLARRFGDATGRFEILTTAHSFHGRTLAGIAATGQAKVKVGFGPPTPGFRCDLPYNDLAAIEAAITPHTAAILIEGIQGEGGITPASPEFLRGLRKLCDQKHLLLMIDAVQCGHFRSGRFQSFQRILEGLAGEDFLPDAVSMAKSLGGGFPMGAFWAREPFSTLLGPGSHATTFGGTPLGCAVALRIFEIIERDGLAQNVREIGTFLKAGLAALAVNYPGVIRGARGLGFMLGLELQAATDIPTLARTDRPAAAQMVDLLHTAGVLTVPSGEQIIRLLPALNLTRAEAVEALERIETVVQSLTPGT
jgi:acetylornithine/N-succinyldiaminopimelate aminotransferase